MQVVALHGGSSLGQAKLAREAGLANNTVAAINSRRFDTRQVRGVSLADWFLEAVFPNPGTALTSRL